MRWVFGLLFLLNGLCFFFGFFLLRPSGELEFVEPSPLTSQTVTSMIVLLKESRLATTSEEPVENDNLNNVVVSDSIPSVAEPRTQLQSHQAPKCFKIGPFQSTLDADRFHAQVGLGDGAWKIDDHAEAVDTAYWVYIPPATNRDESRSTLRNLQVMGVDSFIVSRGEYVNAVSLGTFQKKDSAETLKEQVAAMGFEVSIQEQARSKSSAWLYLQANSAMDQKLIQESALGDVKVSIFSCEMFAQEQILP